MDTSALMAIVLDEAEALACVTALQDQHEVLISTAYQRWGEGVHAAALNFGDCFAYELAKQNGCPLLYVGDDFSKTDVESAL